MREDDFMNLLRGDLNYMQAITGKQMKVHGNILNVIKFYNGFVEPYLAEYLWGKWDKYFQFF